MAAAPSRSFKRPPAKRGGKVIRDVEESKEDKLKKAYQALVGELEDQANTRVGDRAELEKRWELDLRQYHGRYDSTMEARLKKERKSRLFVNITRKRTHGWEARLSDMLFPTDDKNWGVSPTPLPDVATLASKSFKQIQKFGDRANRMRAMGNSQGEAKALSDAAPFVQQQKQADQTLKAAKDAAEAMEKLIEDQLVEAQYAIQVRQAIHDACKVGTGIMKGPMVSSRVRRKFVKDPANPKLWVNKVVASEPVTSWQRVNYYNFFPDMSVPTVEEGEGTFERHLVNAKELRKKQVEEGFDPDSVRELLDAGPTNAVPLFISNIRMINGGMNVDATKMFCIWEWHGILDKDKLETLADYLDTDQARGAVEALQIDQLDELPVVMWFCQGQILKYGIHPLDSGDTMYSAFQFEKDETTPFGYGVPYLMRDSQSALNGAWRMIMDHGNVTTGPQIVIDPNQLEAADGQNRITGNKLWYRTAPKASTPAFEIFQINDNQAQLAKIVEMARDFADEESIMPLIAQGDQGTHTTQTKGGMAILMNASNVVFKRVVKNFDDFMTVPNIRRAYEFNMLHSSIDAVKGDHQVDARGSSVLLVKELQAQNLMAMALQFTAHPVLGPLTKAVDLYRRLVQAHNLPSNEIVKSDDEIQQAQQEAANKQAPDPETERLKAQLQIEQAKGQNAIALEKEKRTTIMIEFAQTHNMTLDKLQTMLDIAALENNTKKQLFQAGAAVDSRNNRHKMRIAGTAGAADKPGTILKNAKPSGASPRAGA